MKKITLLLSFIACVGFMQAQTLLVENFDYNANTVLLGQGLWTVTGTNTAAPLVNVTAKSISYASYPGSEIGNEVTLTNGEDLYKNFTAQTSGAVYVSALVNIKVAPANGDYFIHFGPTDMAGNAYIGRTFVKADASGKIIFGLMQASSGTTTYSTETFDIGSTILLVLKHDVVTKTSSIIVNPSMTTEPATGWLINSTGNNSTANIGSIGLRQPSASAALDMKLDGIRVATSWSALFSTTGVSNANTNSFKAIVSGKNLMLQGVKEGAAVEIYSAIGSKVLSSVVTNGKIDMSSVSKGLYVVRIDKQTQKILF